MNLKPVKITLALEILVLAAAAGCAKPQPAPAPVIIDARGITPKADYTDLATVLKKSINDGLLIPSAARKSGENLERQLKLLAVTGPTATPLLLPTRNDRLAYWYNARTAWAINLALLCNCQEGRGAAELADRPFSLDGRLMTLREIDAAIEKEGGWMAVAAAPCVCIQRAALPPAPLAASDMDQAIPRRLSQFLADDRRFVIDVQRQEALIPPILWRYRQQLIDEHNRAYGSQGANLLTALLPHVSGAAHRRIQDAIGYKIVQEPARLELALQK